MCLIFHIPTLIVANGQQQSGQENGPDIDLADNSVDDTTAEAGRDPQVRISSWRDERSPVRECSHGGGILSNRR